MRIAAFERRASAAPASSNSTAWWQQSKQTPTWRRSNSSAFFASPPAAANAARPAAEKSSSSKKATASAVVSSVAHGSGSSERTISRPVAAPIRASSAATRARFAAPRRFAPASSPNFLQESGVGSPPTPLEAAREASPRAAWSTRASSARHPVDLEPRRRGSRRTGSS
jgi:hypothetical protein